MSSSDAVRVMVSVTDAGWQARHPDLDGPTLQAALTKAGAVVHDVGQPSAPLPELAARRIAVLHARSLAPFAGYGDVLVGVGVLATALRHPCLVLVVDDECAERVRGATGAGPAARTEAGLVLGGLASARSVAVTTERALDTLRRHHIESARLVTAVDDVVKEVLRCAG